VFRGDDDPIRKRGTMDKVKVYKDAANEYRWTRQSENGEKVADSSEGYVDISHCIEMAKVVNGPDCEYIDETDKN